LEKNSLSSYGIFLSTHILGFKEKKITLQRILTNKIDFDIVCPCLSFQTYIKEEKYFLSKLIIPRDVVDGEKLIL